MPPGETQNSFLKAGAAQVDITPAPGIPLTGFIARLGPSTGIHDHLFARSLALAAGGQQALLITCDLLALDANFISSARTRIRETTGIAEKDILIACTHTHSGPATIFLRDCGEVDRAYLDHLRAQLIDVARQAVSNLRAARVASGRGRVSQGALNRRRPGKPIDPDLGVIAFQDKAGRAIAVLVNYACHPVCLGEARLVGIPGEMFSELGKEIKNLFPTHPVLLVGYANDDIGYIPTRQAYASGGYEIYEAYKFYGFPAALAPEAGDLLKQSIARLLEKCPGRASSNESNC